MLSAWDRLLPQFDCGWLLALKYLQCARRCPADSGLWVLTESPIDLDEVKRNRALSFLPMSSIFVKLFSFTNPGDRSYKAGLERCKTDNLSSVRPSGDSCMLESSAKVGKKLATFYS